MSRPRKYTAEQVLDILEFIDPNESDIDNDSTDDEDYVPDHLETGRSRQDSGSSESDDDQHQIQPSTSSAQSVPSGTNKKNSYLWTKNVFNPPDSVFRGKYLELPDNFQMPSPLDFFKQYLTDDMLDLLVANTNQYSVQKSGKSINTSNKELEQVIGMFLKMGLAKMPGVRCYWETDSRYAPVADVMSRNRFLMILSSLKFVDNNMATDDQKQDKLWKIRPWLEEFKKNCLKIIPLECNSIDEMMIPFKGKFSKLKQYVKGKPHPWGIKVWARASSTGILCDFDVYQGKNNSTEKSSLGVGAEVVLKLCASLPQNVAGEALLNYKIFADNFFTSMPLLEKLKEMGIHYTGTVRPNRINSVKLEPEKEMKKKGRGSMDQCVEKKSNVVAVRWYDTRAVNMLSTYSGTEPNNIVKRYDKSKSTYLHVQQPAVIKLYNEKMGGVDLHDCFISKHSFHMRSKRWYLYIFWQTIRMMLVNSWLSYRRCADLLEISKKEVMNQRTFQSKLATLLIQLNASRKRGRPSLENSPEVRVPAMKKKSARKPMPETDVRTDGYHHFLIKKDDRQRCKLCSQKTNNMCEKCEVYLCYTEARNCFRPFHLY